MNGVVVTAALSVWVVFQIWRGFKNGAWAAFFSLLGVVCGYVVTFFYGAKVSELVATLGYDHDSRALVVYPLTFIFVSSCIRHVPMLLFSNLQRRTKGIAFAGGVFGLLSGLFSGLIGVWFVGLVFDALGSKPEIAEGSSEHALPAISRVASSFVATGTKKGMELAGFEETEAEMAANVVKRPNAVFANLQKVMQSDEMRRIMLSGHTQKMMATNDVGSLMSSAEFQDLTALPAMREVAGILSDGLDANTSSDEFLAQQITFIWRRLQYLKNDPRVQDVLADEEVQGHLNQQNYAALFTNAKFQKLVALVMDRQQDMSEVNFTAFVDTGFDENPPSEPAPSLPQYRPQEVYKWRDENGKVRYSDLDQIPDAHLHTAQKLMK